MPPPAKYLVQKNPGIGLIQIFGLVCVCDLIISGGEVTSPEAVTSPQPPSFDDEMLELINEYFYGVRIFPGQDLDGTYVGWV